MFGQDSLSAVCHHRNFELVRGDVRNEDRRCGRSCREADIIIPLAALVGAPLCDRDPLAATTTNRDAIVDMLASCVSRRSGSSCRSPTAATASAKQGKFCTEETPLRPVSLYGRDKVEAETHAARPPPDGHQPPPGDGVRHVAADAARSAGQRLHLPRRTRPVHRAVRGHFKRNYIHVRDVARAFLHAIDQFDAMKGAALQRRALGREPVEAGAVRADPAAAAEVRLPGIARSAKDPDKRDYIVSNEKIERTGFKPASRSTMASRSS